jgi:hypothetical protein
VTGVSDVSVAGSAAVGILAFYISMRSFDISSFSCWMFALSYLQEVSSCSLVV